MGGGDASHADTSESAGASVGGHPAASEGDEGSQPLHFKRSHSSAARGRVGRLLMMDYHPLFQLLWPALLRSPRRSVGWGCCFAWAPHLLGTFFLLVCYAAEFASDSDSGRVVVPLLLEPRLLRARLLLTFSRLTLVPRRIDRCRPLLLLHLVRVKNPRLLRLAGLRLLLRENLLRRRSPCFLRGIF